MKFDASTPKKNSKPRQRPVALSLVYIINIVSFPVVQIKSEWIVDTITQIYLFTVLQYTVLTLNDLPCSCLGSDSHWIPLVLSSSLPCTGVCKRDVMEKKKKKKKKKQTNLSVFNQCNANWGGFEMITRFLRYPRGFYPYHILP